jgi:hypothetical protein
MSLSTLNPPLPALEDLITLTPQPATPTKKGIGLRLSRDIRRDILLYATSITTMRLNI